jgi:hypothetical protein
MNQASRAGRWEYDPEREAAWQIAIYPALLRSMARAPDWAREVIAAKAERYGEEAAEKLRQDARTAYRAMRDAGEL